MLTFGRRPRAPTDIPIPTSPEPGTTREELYWSLTNRCKQWEETARKNQDKSARASKAQYDRGKNESGVRAGDTVLLRKELRGCLDQKSTGPYTVLTRSGEDVKISMPEKDKWVHLNRCEPYEKSRLTIPPLESTGKEAVELNTPEGYRGNQGALTQEDRYSSLHVYTMTYLLVLIH